MIVVMKQAACSKEIDAVEKRLVSMGFLPHRIQGTARVVIGAVGEQSVQFPTGLEVLDGVERVVPITAPYKLVSRQVKENDSVVKVDEVVIGGEELIIMAGPCAVESEEQLLTIAKHVKKSGAKVLRGGAYKPRSSPYSFQGLQQEGLKMLRTARAETGLKIITEVLDTNDLELVAGYADIIQIGARNMQNYTLLREIGRSKKPVLLKRGLAATVEEWLMSAEYILSEGNFNLILCERGIRTFEKWTRNTLDISAIPQVKALSHLPIIADPSHSSGSWRLASPLSKAAIAAGADGLLIEVHHNPSEALCDGSQSLTPENFDLLIKDLLPVALAVGRLIQKDMIAETL